MILRENITLLIGGGHDDNGNSVPPTEHPTYAELSPLTAEESFSAGRDPSSVSYRMVFVWPDVLPASTAVTWRGTTYSFVGPSMLYTVLGRVHHQEAIVTSATG